MDFITGLPLTSRRHNAILVVVDRLTKTAHFIPVNERYSVDQLAKLYIDHIVMLHGASRRILSDRGS